MFEQFWEQRKNLPIALDTASVKVKTYIITGSNTGLGLECAKHLSELGATRVIMAVRNLSAGEKAKASLPTTACDVQVWHLDMSSYDSIKSFAKKVETLDRVDGVVENAAVASGSWSISENNETSITVNTVGTMLLLTLLTPILKATAQKYKTKPVITLVGSEVAFLAQGLRDQTNVDDIFVDLRDEQKWSSQFGTFYPYSKLLLILAYREFTTKIVTEKSGISVNYVNPGLCTTTLSRNAPLVMRTVIGFYKMIMGRTPEKGSRTLIHGLTGEGHGKYLSACEVHDERVPEWITNENGREWQRKLWAELEDILNDTAPGCVKRAC